MSKYGIIQKELNDQGTQILNVEVREIKGKQVNSRSAVWSRDKVVSAIKQGSSFVTILRKPTSGWTREGNVHVVEVDGIEYLRTDQDRKPSDNLGSLPNFQ
jgi:hypothetical protein